MFPERRRTLRVVLLYLLVLAGVLITIKTSDGNSDEAVLEPEMQLRLGRQHLSLMSTSSSKEHEAAMLELIADQFQGVQVQTDFRPGLNIPQEWDVVSARLIYLVAATNSAEATIDANGIAIRGVSNDGDNYRQRLEFLHGALPDGTVVKSDVLLNNSAVSTAAMCRRNFASISKQTIQFRQSGTAIRQSSYPLLDRLIEFAYDCRTSKIAITGHTDASGDESWNLTLSRARAQAVADHLIANGVAADQLIIEGVGSQQPLAENDTVQGRERNRRTETELRQF